MSDLIFSGRGIFANRSHAPYDVLAHLEPGLMLDIGASNGNFAKLMLAKSPRSRVVAFEPFPGNLPILRQAAADDPRIEVVEKAVSDDGADMPFFVSSVVKEGVPEGWHPGFSAVGHILTTEKPQQGQTIVVQTIGVDEAIGDQHVRFMKVDVQGGEMSVLRSASQALMEQRIDILHLEFCAERDLFAQVQALGYIIFDSQYGLIPLRDPVHLEKWDVTGPLKLSTGRSAYRAWPKEMPTTAAGYLDFVEAERKKIGNLFTDLVCVSPRFFPAFLTAAIVYKNSTA